MSGPACPNCNSTKTSVVNSRRIPDAVKRRRVCEDCGGRFTTYEKVGKVVLPKVDK
jgi:transcriptional repressor NrdR